MNEPGSFSEMEAFARKRIDASRYPGDYHTFRLFRCPACGVVPFEVIIEHHTGSRKGDFKGVILGQCSQCGRQERVFSFTGEHRKPLRQKNPVCRCGDKRFFVAECERIEREEGIFGFFDEGVVVGQCAGCGRNRVLVETD